MNLPSFMSRISIELHMNVGRIIKSVYLRMGYYSQLVIPHSYFFASSMAQVIIDKYVNYMLLYRQKAAWDRLGLKLSKTTMANWIIISAKEYFISLVDRIHELLVIESHVYCDETMIQALNEPGKRNTNTSYMWIYSSIKESKDPIKILEYQPDRSASRYQNFLKGFEGIIVLMVLGMHIAGRF